MTVFPCGVVVFVEAQQGIGPVHPLVGVKAVFPIVVQTRPYRRGQVV